MKKIALSLLSIATIAGLAIGATSAYFTSTKSTQMNTFAAGTLNVDAAVGGAYNFESVNIGHLAPGEITGVKTFTIKNTGDIDAATFARFTFANDTGLGKYLKIYDYKVEFFKADGTKANRWNATNSDNYYGEDINQDYFIKNGDDTKWKAIGGTSNFREWVLGDGPEDNVFSEGVRSWDVEGLPAGAYYTVSVKFQMDPEATNEAMGKKIDIGYEVKATQLNNEATTALGFPGNWGKIAANQLPTYK